MSDVHALTIYIPDGGTDWGYTVDCPGVSDACRMMVECDFPTCSADELADCASFRPDRLGSAAELHGRTHLRDGGEWWVPTDTCYVKIADNLHELVMELVAQEALRVGRYRVWHQFENGDLRALLLQPPDREH